MVEYFHQKPRRKNKIIWTNYGLDNLSNKIVELFYIKMIERKLQKEKRKTIIWTHENYIELDDKTMDKHREEIDLDNLSIKNS